MGYYIDFKHISVGKYRDELKTAPLTKSRLILKTNTDKIFEMIKSKGVKNVEELQNLLKTKAKLKAFAVKSGISEEYLTILLREINSNHPKPNKIKDFPNISNELVNKLEKKGIKNTFQLFQKVLTKNDREIFSKESSIAEKSVMKLTKLVDLSRIRLVNHTFAYMLYEIGYDTVEKVTEADYEMLHKEVNQFNKKQNIYKGHIGVNDIKLTVEAAKKVPLDISY